MAPAQSLGFERTRPSSGRVGVALAGLFTASVASILIERSLRSREVSNLEMSDHLVLCNWSPRALDWIREVHSGIVTTCGQS